MTSDAVIEAYVDPDVRDRVAAVLEGAGLSLSDAVGILLAQIAEDGAFSFPGDGDAPAHDAWFRAQVLQALDNPRPAVTRGEVEAHFAARRRAAMRKAVPGSA